MTRRLALALIPCILSSTRISAQTQYYELDALRPVRVEDSGGAERFALEAQFAPLRFERLAGGVFRWRTEPRLAYGVLPATEISVRLPIVLIQPRVAGAANTLGIAGVGIEVGHAFRPETARAPGAALAGEVLLPAGKLAAPQPTYSIKGLLSRSTPWGRMHLNVSIGSYSTPARLPGDQEGCRLHLRYRLPGSCHEGTGIPVIIDISCRLAPADPHLASSAARCAPPGIPPVVLADSVQPAPLRGTRWMAGLAFDHAFPAHSTAVIADLYAEHFIGLYPGIDWTVEAGLRHQLGPHFVIDFGVSAHFAGVVRSNAAALGATYYLRRGRRAGLP
jgi:hypothetical protein